MQEEKGLYHDLIGSEEIRGVGGNTTISKAEREKTLKRDVELKSEGFG